MKKQWTARASFLLLAVPLLFLGCGEDDPVDPPTETCSVTVSNPTSGSSFIPGDPDNDNMPIRWAETGEATRVSVELLKAGSVVGIISGSAPNSGFYSWTADNMDAANGDDFSIRITALGEDNCLGLSGQFSLTNTVGCSLDFLTVFDPDIDLIAGNELTLTWDSDHTLGNVSIELWRQDTDARIGYINDSALDDDGSYTWVIDSLNSGTYQSYFLKIVANGVDDCFGISGDFPMVDDDLCIIGMMAPQPGAVWTEGQSYDIDISPSEGVTSVNLMLYKNFEFLGNINFAPILVEDFPYTWEQVSDFGNESGTDTYRIKAVNNDDQYCVGISETFTIISTQ